jgi:hypothetical protein
VTGRIQRIFAGSLAALAVSAALIGGTVASFNANVTNPGNVVSNGTVSLTNVAGTAVAGTNCATETASGACATLFSAATTSLAPGAPDVSNTVTVTYKGTLTTSAFVAYTGAYVSKSGGSSGLCTASDPGAHIQLQVKQGSTIVFPTLAQGGTYGTLDYFATTYTSPANGLPLKGGNNGSGSSGLWTTNDNSVFTISLNLPSGTSNAYQGCQSTFELAWYAAQ